MFWFPLQAEVRLSMQKTIRYTVAFTLTVEAFNNPGFFGPTDSIYPNGNFHQTKRLYIYLLSFVDVNCQSFIPPLRIFTKIIVDG